MARLAADLHQQMYLDPSEFLVVLTFAVAELERLRGDLQAYIEEDLHHDHD